VLKNHHHYGIHHHTQLKNHAHHNGSTPINHKLLQLQSPHGFGIHQPQHQLQLQSQSKNQFHTVKLSSQQSSPLLKHSQPGHQHSDKPLSHSSHTTKLLPQLLKSSQSLHTNQSMFHQSDGSTPQLPQFKPSQLHIHSTIHTHQSSPPHGSGHQLSVNQYQQSHTLLKLLSMSQHKAQSSQLLKFTAPSIQASDHGFQSQSLNKSPLPHQLAFTIHLLQLAMSPLFGHQQYIHMLKQLSPTTLLSPQQSITTE